MNVRTIQNAIKTVLVNVDPRTKKKYLDCFRNFALKANGKPENYGLYNLTGFRDAVFGKLEEV